MAMEGRYTVIKVVLCVQDFIAEKPIGAPMKLTGS